MKYETKRRQTYLILSC